MVHTMPTAWGRGLSTVWEENHLKGDLQASCTG